MRRLVGLFLIGSNIFSPALTTQRAPAHLNGIVVSEDGTPIEGVKIYASHEGTTDAKGTFDLPSDPEKAPVIFFKRRGSAQRQWLSNPSPG